MINLEKLNSTVNLMEFSKKLLEMVKSLKVKFSGFFENIFFSPKQNVDSHPVEITIRLTLEELFSGFFN
jgi:hypothetical protein